MAWLSAGLVQSARANAFMLSVIKLHGCSYIPPPSRPTSPSLSSIPRLTCGARLAAMHALAVMPIDRPRSANAG